MLEKKNVHKISNIITLPLINHKGVKCYIQLEKLPALSFTHKQPGQWAEKYCK